jgi:hypothetical protein
MPWNYTYESRLGVGVVVASGILSADEVVTGFLAALRDPRFLPDHHILYEFSRVVGCEHSMDELLTFRYGGYHSPRARRAFVVDDYFSGRLRRHLQLHPLAGPAAVFPEVTAAVEWLHEGIPPWRMPI